MCTENLQLYHCEEKELLIVDHEVVNSAAQAQETLLPYEFQSTQPVQL